MTDKVMIENEGLSKKEIESKIRDSFKPKECNSTIDEITIVWLPWDKKDVLVTDANGYELIGEILPEEDE